MQDLKENPGFGVQHFTGTGDDLETARTSVGGVRLSWAFRSRCCFGSVYMHFLHRVLVRGLGYDALAATQFLNEYISLVIYPRRLDSELL